MSQTAINMQQQQYDAGAAKVDMKFRSHAYPRLRRRPSKRVLHKARVAARRRQRSGKRLSPCSVNASWVRVLDLVRQGSHDSRAWLVPGCADSLRYRSRLQ
jgi:hypothetical protein